MLSTININEFQKWDDIVRSFNNYDVNYLSGYARAFQFEGEGEPLLFYYNDGTTRAINVVMKRDIAQAKQFKDILPEGTYYDLSTPYGYGGFLIEGQNSEAVNSAYDAYCIENGFICEFVRFHLINNYHLNYTGLTETYTKNVIRDLKLPLDEMFMDFEHKVRKSIKKAIKADLEIQIDSTGSRLEDYLKIYYGTMDRSNAKENFYFKEEFFRVINEMTDSFVYFHVIFEGQVISTELVIYGTENCYSFLGGTNKDFFHLNANNFLKFEIIKWAKEKGLKRYILGGGYGKDDGIYKYKKSFAPNGICDFYVGKKIFNENKYKELVEIRNQEAGFDANTAFFPAYRG